MVLGWRGACLPVPQKWHDEDLRRKAARRKPTDAPEGVIDFKWSPDGRHIGYLAADPNPEQAAKRKTGDDAIVAGEGFTPTRLHIIPVDGGSERVFPSSGRHLLSFDW